MKPNSFIYAPLLILASASPLLAQSVQRGEQYNVTGVTLYEPADLIGYASQVALHHHGGIRPETLARAVETIYREDGYLLAEVFVAQDGRTLVVDEGEIGTLSIEGVDASTARLIGAIVRPVLGTRGVNQKDVERVTMLVGDIESVSATTELDYPPGAAHARLRVIAEVGDTSFGAVTLDHPSRSFGEAATLTLSHTFLGALAPGDLLRFEVSAQTNFETDDDSEWGALSYRLPLGAGGAYAEAYVGSVTAHRDASGALLATEIDGRTGLLAFGYPVVRNIDTYGYALFELRRSSSYVDVGATSFASSVDVASLSWIHGRTLSDGGVWEYAVQLSSGRQREAATGFDDGDGSFSFLRFGAAYDRQVSWFGPNSMIRAEFWGQLSGDRLPGIEEFYLGGRHDERGYLFAEARGDSGVSATFEFGRDLYPQRGAVQRLRPFGFVDVGHVTNNRPSVTELDEVTLASTGVGVEMEFQSGFFLESYVVSPLSDGPSTAAGVPAVYLGLTKRW